MRVGRACDADEVAVLAVVDDDGAVGIIGGRLLSGRRGPSRGDDLRSH